MGCAEGNTDHFLNTFNWILYQGQHIHDIFGFFNPTHSDKSSGGIFETIVSYFAHLLSSLELTRQEK
jgi:hypothetical protein